MRSLYTALTLVLCVGALFAAERQLQPEEPQIELTSVRVNDEDQVEMKFGDVTLIAKELSFVHADGNTTRVRTIEGRIEMKNAMTTLTAKKISSRFGGGIFGRNDLDSRGRNK